jgi:hypothetical protein
MSVVARYVAAGRAPLEERCDHARGGVLFEVLLSIALFVGASTFALGATSNVLRAIDRAQRRAFAIDLACSKMAELEAGHITTADLDSEADIAVGSMEPAAVDEATSDPAVRSVEWVFEVRTSPTEFTGLSLVELTVSEMRPAWEADDDDLVSFTLRQLVALREDDESVEYEQDDLLRGLPGIEP